MVEYLVKVMEILRLPLLAIPTLMVECLVKVMEILRPPLQVTLILMVECLVKVMEILPAPLVFNTRKRSLIPTPMEVLLVEDINLML